MTQTNETRYVYAGTDVIQERSSQNLPLVTYTTGLSLLARTDTSGTLFYHVDGNNYVTMLVNGQGTVMASYTYDPYGNIISKSGPMADANLYRFASQEINPTAGIYAYLFRFYDPNLQRWLTKDPIGLRGGRNVFAFVGNNPINRIDPLGLNSYVVNAGGYTGHTSFVVDNPAGGVIAYHFFAEHHGGDAPWYMQDMGLFYDGVHIWSQYALSLIHISEPTRPY